MIIMFSSTEIWSFIQGNTFNESTVIENLGYDNTVEYSVQLDQANVAFQFVDTTDENAIADVYDYLQFYFVKTEKTPAGITNQVIEALRCMTKYPVETSDAQLIEQF